MQKEQYKRLLELANGAVQELRRLNSEVLANQLERQVNKFLLDPERLQD